MRKGKLGCFNGEMTPDYRRMIGPLFYLTCGAEFVAKSAARDECLYNILTKEIKSQWTEAEQRSQQQNENYLESLLDLHDVQVEIVKGQKDTALMTQN